PSASSVATQPPATPDAGSSAAPSWPPPACGRAGPGCAPRGRAPPGCSAPPTCWRSVPPTPWPARWGPGRSSASSPARPRARRPRLLVALVGRYRPPLVALRQADVLPGHDRAEPDPLDVEGEVAHQAQGRPPRGEAGLAPGRRGHGLHLLADVAALGLQTVEE